MSEVDGGEELVCGQIKGALSAGAVGLDVLIVGNELSQVTPESMLRSKLRSWHFIRLRILCCLAVLVEAHSY